LHSIHIKDAEITPSVISVTLDLHGKTAHAAEPQKGLNPTYLISELQVKLKKICQLDPSKGGFQIITPIFTNIGSPDFGISAGNGRVGFTLRTTTNEAMELLKQEFVSVVERLSDSYKIPYSIQWTQAFRANKNAPLAANAIRWAAKEHNLKLIERDAPFPWGEDFGIFTEQFPGALFGLGAGEDQPALHNPDYDFPDELIDTGKRMFLSLIEGEIE
jgi:metal-dependent amidase/aminoacylase/carboxypeptidase family protein